MSLTNTIQTAAVESLSANPQEVLLTKEGEIILEDLGESFAVRIRTLGEHRLSFIPSRETGLQIGINFIDESSNEVKTRKLFPNTGVISSKLFTDADPNSFGPSIPLAMINRNNLPVRRIEFELAKGKGLKTVNELRDLILRLSSTEPRPRKLSAKPIEKEDKTQSKDKLAASPNIETAEKVLAFYLLLFKEKYIPASNLAPLPEYILRTVNAGINREGNINPTRKKLLRQNIAGIISQLNTTIETLDGNLPNKAEFEQALTSLNSLLR
jgi:hypothetical protein